MDTSILIDWLYDMITVAVAFGLVACLLLIVISLASLGGGNDDT